MTLKFPTTRKKTQFECNLSMALKHAPPRQSHRSSRKVNEPRTKPSMWNALRSSPPLGKLNSKNSERITSSPIQFCHLRY